MIVISDSSPLIVLVKIGHIDILPALFDVVLIPPAVSAELISDSRPDSIKAYFSHPPSWLKTQRPLHNQQIHDLHPGGNGGNSSGVGTCG